MCMCMCVCVILHVHIDIYGFALMAKIFRDEKDKRLRYIFHLKKDNYFGLVLVGLHISTFC